METFDVVMVCVGLLSLIALVFGVVKFRQVRRDERAREKARLIIWLAENEKQAKAEREAEASTEALIDAALATPPLVAVAAVAAVPVEKVVEEPWPVVEESLVQEPSPLVRTVAEEMADFFGHSSPSIGTGPPAPPNDARTD